MERQNLNRVQERHCHDELMILILDLDEGRHVDLAVLQLGGHHVPQADDSLATGGFSIVKFHPLVIFSEDFSVANMKIKAGHGDVMPQRHSGFNGPGSKHGNPV